MKKMISVLAVWCVAFVAFSAQAKESLVDKTPEWWKQATPEVIEDLIKKGADVNEKDDSGWTPLMVATNNNQNPEITKILIEHGADFEAKTDQGITAIEIAVFDDSNEIVQMLIEHGANVNAKNKFGATALEWATRFDSDAEKVKIIQILIEHGADVNSRDEDGYSILMHAMISNKDINVIKMLIEKGATITSDEAKYIFMSAAGLNKNPEVIKELLHRGADINKKYEPGTALSWAIGHRNIEVVDFLLNNGAKTDDMTLIHAAKCNPKSFVAETENKCPELIKILIQNGANANIIDSNGKTALDYARENPYLYNTDAYRLLEEKTNNKKIKIVSHDALNCTIEHNKQICEEADLQPFTGVAIFYHFGNVLSKTPYKNGLVDGKVKAYDAIDGHMHLEADYKQGELLKATCYNKYGQVIQCRCDMFNWRIKRIMNQCR